VVDKFVSPGTPCTPHQHELLTILVEECGEVTIRATKAKRFGLDETQPGQKWTNTQRLAHEIGDVLTMIKYVPRHCGVTDEDIAHGMHRKEQQLARYLQTSPDHFEKGSANG
jgi:NTP pyrophosphatase (non-canonical NTP hydrolase)